jgi:hypothetical protein
VSVNGPNVVEAEFLEESSTGCNATDVLIELLVYSL